MGQHFSSAMGGFGVVADAGADAQNSRVQLDWLLTPLKGQVHVFSPSPAG